MVGKIMKHELYALGRVLIIFGIAVIGFAILLRLSGLGLGSGTLAFFSISLFFYIFSLLALLIGAFALGISRFFKTLFTGEGYLTLSFPATATQLIVAKLLSTLIAVLFAIVVCLLSGLIFFIGISTENWEYFVTSLKEVFDQFGIILTNDPLAIVELILYILAWIPLPVLYFYLMACVGQTFTKRRTLMTCVITAGSLFVISLLNSLVFQPLLLSCEAEVSAHLAMWIAILVYAGLDLGCFFLVRYIIKNKVNLIV